MEHKISVPITFNPHKHHFQFLKKKIESWKKQDWNNVETELLCIGGNLLDLYTGPLTVEEICLESIRYFKNEKISNKTSFMKWLDSQEYKYIQLSDSSIWIVKEGIDPNRYIHIHPAKKSPFTIRVRAITLKTVIVLQVHHQIIQNDLKKNLQMVNNTRIQYLQLSPVKSLQHDKGILQLWKRFEENLNYELQH